MTAIKSIRWDGKQITKPGIYSNVPIDTYHRHDICDAPSISSSGLRLIFNKSLAHFYDQWSGNPKRTEDDEEKAHFVLGRALHHLVLGEKFFSNLFAVQPEEWPDETGLLKPWQNNRNVCKRWNAERRKEGRSVLTKGMVVALREMAKALGNNPIVQAGALSGQIERSMFWKDKRTGIWLKSRPDSIPGDSGDFVDLKTTTSTLWYDMQRTLTDLGYNQQGALIRDGARIVLKIQQPTFTLVFAEKKKPYCTRVVTLKDNDLDRGRRQNEWALEQFATALKTGEWPGPGGNKHDAEYIEMAERDQKAIDEKLSINA